jgi:hypothetical protein
MGVGVVWATGAPVEAGRGGEGVEGRVGEGRPIAPVTTGAGTRSGVRPEPPITPALAEIGPLDGREWMWRRRCPGRRCGTVIAVEELVAPGVGALGAAAGEIGC